MKKVLAVLLMGTMSLNICGMEEELNAFKPNDISHVKLLKKGGIFSTHDGQKRRMINPAFIDKRIKILKPGQLKTLLSNDFYLKLNKFNNSDDYKLELAGRQRGGGLGLAILTFVGGTAAVIVSNIALVKKNEHKPVAAGTAAGACTMTGMGLVADLTAKALAVPGF